MRCPGSGYVGSVIVVTLLISASLAVVVCVRERLWSGRCGEGAARFVFWARRA